MKKLNKTKIIKTIQAKFTRSNIVLHWCLFPETKDNWGDALNPYLVEMLSQKRIINAAEVYKIRGIKIYYAIGSILDRLNRENVYVWGSGFRLTNSTIYKKPKKVFAVRGPLTRQRLINQGVDCPEIYGDPALLFPKFYNPNIEKKYKIGIIPHHSERNNSFCQKVEGDDVKIIDIYSDLFSFVDQIKSCEIIASSSLHGIIASDAYNVPNLWVQFSNNIDEFKFYDYFESVGRNDRPIVINEQSHLDQIFENIDWRPIKIDLDKLIKSCPFIALDVKEKLLKK